MNDFINKVNNELNIVDVIGDEIKLTKKGRDYVGLCPFHDDKNPSLSVSPSKKIFKCFSCNISGNAIYFYSKIKNISITKAAYDLIIKYNLNINTNKIKIIDFNKEFQKEQMFLINDRASNIFHRILINKKNDLAKEFLEKKQISNNSIQKFNIGFAPYKSENTIIKYLSNESEVYLNDPSSKEYFFNKELLEKVGLLTYDDTRKKYSDFFSNRIIIPIHDVNNHTVGFSGRSINTKEENIKYLNTPTNEIFHKDSLIFNLNNIKNNTDTIYITEGYWDVISMDQLGFSNFCALMGTSINQNNLENLKSKNIKTIILCMDNDQAGIEANISIGIKLLKWKFNVFVVNEYDQKFKDLNELAIAMPKDNINKIINNYVSYVSYFIANNLKKAKNKNELATAIKKIDQTIVTYGDELLINEYIQIFKTYTNYDEEDIKTKIYNLFKKNKTIITKKTEENNYKITAEMLDIDTETNLKKGLIKILIINPKVYKIYLSCLRFLPDEKNDDYDCLINIIISCIANINHDNDFYSYELISSVKEKINKFKKIQSSALNRYFDECVNEVNQYKNIEKYNYINLIEKLFNIKCLKAINNLDKKIIDNKKKYNEFLVYLENIKKKIK